MARTRERNGDPTSQFDSDADFLRDLACDGYHNQWELEEFLVGYDLLRNKIPGFVFTTARRLITVILESGKIDCLFESWSVTVA